MPTQTYERWVSDGNNIKEGLEEKGYTVDMQYADDDIPTQQQQLDQMITQERSEEHTSELQSRGHLVCRLLLEKNSSIKKLIYYEKLPIILKCVLSKAS